MPTPTGFSATRIAKARTDAQRQLADEGVSDAMVQVHEDGSLSASGTAWTPVSLGAGQPLWLQLPVVAEGRINAAGRIELKLCPADAEVLAEGEAYARSLLARGELAEPGVLRRPGTTHEVFIDDQGRRCLRRRGFA